MRPSKTWRPEKVWDYLRTYVPSTVVFVLALAVLRLDSELAFPWKVDATQSSVRTLQGVDLLLDSTRPLSASDDQVLIPVIISPVRSLYEASQLLPKLRGVTLEARRYTGDNEADQTAPALLSVPFSQTGIAGEYRVSPNGQDALTFKIAPTSAGIPTLPGKQMGFLVVACLLVLLAGARKSLSGIAALALLILVFEFPGASLSFPLKFAAFALALSLSFVSKRNLPLMEPRPRLDGKSYFILAIAAVLGLAYYLQVSSDFRWSIFEERDFLAARAVLQNGELPSLGPQLLAGGQTPGGALYLLMAPLLILKNDPTILAGFTKVSYLASALLFLFTLLKFVGPAGAIVGTLLFCSSPMVMALAYWPIHPNFSLLLSFLFLHFALLFFVDRKPFAAVLATALLSVLLQFHITYALIALPFLAGLLFSGVPRKRKWLSYCAIAFCVPYVPYFAHELTTGFSNSRLLLAQPRYHPLFVPQRPLMVHYGVDLLKNWIGGPGSVGRWLGVALILSSMIFGIARPKNTLTKFTILFFGLPFLALAFFGMGYAPRHFLALAAVTFFVMAYGAESLARALPTRIAHAGVWVLGGLLFFSFARTLTDKPQLLAISTREGEWAVSFAQRRQVAELLIRDLGISQAQYERQAFWYWLGWSLDPRIYADEQARLADHRGPVRSLDPTHTLFLFNETPRALFQSNYDLKPLGTSAGITVYDGTPKTSRPPASNASNRTQLTREESAIENKRFEEGVSSLAPGRSVLSLHGDRLKFQLSTNVTERDGDFSLSWDLLSPHFSGYYQEIKTLWRPTLVLERVDKKSRREVPVAEVLGSLLEKTPRAGTVVLDGSPRDWLIHLRVSGYFDQSSMQAPNLEEKVFQLNPSGPSVMTTL